MTRVYCAPARGLSGNAGGLSANQPVPAASASAAATIHNHGPRRSLAAAGSHRGPNLVDAPQIDREIARTLIALLRIFGEPYRGSLPSEGLLYAAPVPGC